MRFNIVLSVFFTFFSSVIAFAQTNQDSKLPSYAYLYLNSVTSNRSIESWAVDFSDSTSTTQLSELGTLRPAYVNRDEKNRFAMKAFLHLNKLGYSLQCTITPSSTLISIMYIFIKP